MGKPPDPARIYVLAGTNGAGKSSIIGAAFATKGAAFFNPDEAARRILAANPGISQTQANSVAWYEGRRMLQRAISGKLDYAFETTLGGQTITALLEKAISERIEVRVLYVGLSNSELHIARVRSRVEHGGHDIPDETIRQRYTASRLNLIRLLPRLTELRVFDNSVEADPETGARPEPKLVLHLRCGEIAESCDLREVPGWAKPIFAAALNRGKSR